MIFLPYWLSSWVHLFEIINFLLRFLCDSVFIIYLHNVRFSVYGVNRWLFLFVYTSSRTRVVEERVDAVPQSRLMDYDQTQLLGCLRIMGLVLRSVRKHLGLYASRTPIILHRKHRRTHHLEFPSKRVAFRFLGQKLDFCPQKGVCATNKTDPFFVSAIM